MVSKSRGESTADLRSDGSVGISPSQVVLPTLMGAMKCKILPNVKTYFVRITLGLSEAVVRDLDVGARRARVKATSKRA